MLVENYQLVSVNDTIRKMCLPNNPKASISTFVGKFTQLVSKYVFEDARCYRADADDKTKHILIDVNLLLNVFNDKEFIGNLKVLQIDSVTLSKKFYNLEGVCCCCTKKLKKAITSAEAFSDFVKAGPVVLDSFNRIKASLERIVCLDIEAFEFDHAKILEIGLAVYNLRTGRTEAHHIIIDDHAHLTNGKYVTNNRDKFNFGTSQVLRLSAAIQTIKAHLSVANTCLLGHNIKSDIHFLNQDHSFKINVPVFDTQAIFKYHSLSMHPAALSKVLDDLKIPYTNLHNAGNDAFYTLLAFAKLAQLRN